MTVVPAQLLESIGDADVLGDDESSVHGASERETPVPSDWTALDLREAGRFIQTSARQEQEAAWSQANIDARQIWGVREAMRIHGDRLRRAMVDLRRVRILMDGAAQKQSLLRNLIPPVISRIAEFDSGSGDCANFITGAPRKHSRGKTDGLTVCVRKRPLLKFELESQEWEAIEIDNREASVLCHDGRLARSGRKLEMTHRRFLVDHVWGCCTTTDAVYEDVVRPLVDSVLGGGHATVLCMGQTGTGKTYTLRGLVERLDRDLRGRKVQVGFFENQGRKCFDLLAGRQEIQMRVDGEERVHLRGQTHLNFAENEAFGTALEAALGLRAAEATERNAASSRSHAVCTLRLETGLLRIIDLAGSERNYETTKMTAQQHRESAEINTSLMALKDCFRAHAAQQDGEVAKMPLRASRLTMLLRDCFLDPKHRFTLIATVSPTATDVIHTVNTLRHATMLAKPLADSSTSVVRNIPLIFGSQDVDLQNKPVLQWNHDDVMRWMVQAESGRFAHLVVPPALDGHMLLSSSAQGLSALFEGTLRNARAEGEGEAWNVQAALGGQYDDEAPEVDGITVPSNGRRRVTATERQMAVLGKDLFAAARRVAISQSTLMGERS